MPTLGNATSIHRRVSVDRTRSFAVATFSDVHAFDSQLDGVARIVGDDPALVICFASPLVPRAELVAGVEAMAPGVPMIGCTSSGIVERHGSFGAALQLIVLGGEGFDARTALGDCGALGSRGAGRLVGQAVPPPADGVNRALLLLSDGRRWRRGRGGAGSLRNGRRRRVHRRRLRRRRPCHGTNLPVRRIASVGVGGGGRRVDLHRPDGNRGGARLDSGGGTNGRDRIRGDVDPRPR